MIAQQPLILQQMQRVTPSSPVCPQFPSPPPSTHCVHVRLADVWLSYTAGEKVVRGFAVAPIAPSVEVEPGVEPLLGSDGSTMRPTTGYLLANLSTH